MHVTCDAVEGVVDQITFGMAAIREMADVVTTAAQQSGLDKVVPHSIVL
jgi:hypothetical protein